MSTPYRIILIAIGITFVVMTAVVVYYLHNLSADIHSVHKQEDHYVYEWREISTHRWSDLNKSITVDSYKKRGTADWEKKAWKEIRGVDLEGWEYAGTLSSSEKSIIILVRKRVINV